MNKLGQMMGMATNSEVALINQQSIPAPYREQDLLILEDTTGECYPVEVTESLAFGEMEPATIQGIIKGESTLHLDGIDKKKAVYVAKARSLRSLSTPIPPDCTVRRPRFDEIEEHLIHADSDRSFHLGIVKGTNELQSELPDALQNISPMWSKTKDKVVKQEGVPFMYDYTSLREYPHIGLFGSSGSGKSFGMHSILEEFMKKRIPGVILDPHNEGVFKKTMKGLPKEHQMEFEGKYDTFKVGYNVGIPFSELMVDDLYYLLDFVGGVSDAQRSALDAIYERGDTFSFLKTKLSYLKVCYDYYDTPKWQREPKDEDEFRRTNEDAVLFYDKVKQRIANVSVVDALSWRLEMLEKTDVFDDKYGIEKVESAIKNGKLAIIQGSIRKLQMVSAYLIRTLYGKRRAYVDSKDSYANERPFFPPFIVGGDEFHNFAPNHDHNPTKRVIKEIAKEARKYGVYLVVSTQRTSAIDEDVFAQLNTKFIYRLNTFNDIELTRKEANLSEQQADMLPKLTVGHAFVVNPKLPRTMLIQFRSTITEPSIVLDPFDELEEHLASTNSELVNVLDLLVKRRPINVTDIPRKTIPFIREEMDTPVTFEEVIETLDHMVETGLIKSTKTPVGMQYTA